MEDTEFREKVLVGLTKLEQQGETTLSHLQQINGSVKTLFNRVEASEKALLEHQIECPVKDKVELIQMELMSGSHPGSAEVRKELLEAEKTEAARVAKEATSQKWWKVLQPMIWFCISAILTGLALLVLSHSNLFIRK